MAFPGLCCGGSFGKGHPFPCLGGDGLPPQVSPEAPRSGSDPQSPSLEEAGGGSRLRGSTSWDRGALRPGGRGWDPGVCACAPRGGLCADPGTFRVGPQNQARNGQNPVCLCCSSQATRVGKAGRPGRTGLICGSPVREIGARECARHPVTSLPVSNVYPGLTGAKASHHAVRGLKY